ncbi:hypothetical protein [Candidatus Amarolinea dominans]|uniref:hypothetical protein n=1 Tax=Candidatus Amarolinea dominans TaxID=3140696 RepID=UPI0031366AF3|nr:hypothetical protein [Anaerolineae bacterium]
MKRTNNDTTLPGQWVQILQQTLVHLAHSNFTINVGNSHRQGDRLGHHHRRDSPMYRLQ